MVVGGRKPYETVYWGKMPVNFLPQEFYATEVEAAVGRAGRAFPDVLALVPDFSLLEVRGGPGAGQISGALILGHGAEPEVLRSGAGLWGLLRGTAARVRQGQASTAGSGEVTAAKTRA